LIFSLLSFCSTLSSIACSRQLVPRRLRLETSCLYTSSRYRNTFVASRSIRLSSEKPPLYAYRASTTQYHKPWVNTYARLLPSAYHNPPLTHNLRTPPQALHQPTLPPAATTAVVVKQQTTTATPPPPHPKTATIHPNKAPINVASCLSNNKDILLSKATRLNRDMVGLREVSSRCIINSNSRDTRRRVVICSSRRSRVVGLGVFVLVC
jgi:hypothetical protein